MLAAIASGCTSGAAAVPTATADRSAAQTTESLPPGGITKDQAIELARHNVRETAVLQGATAGRFEAVRPPDQLLGPAFPVKPDRLVWAVAFSDEFELCAPDGSGCSSPRPGVSTVILDYNTGEFLSTMSLSPPSG